MFEAKPKKRIGHFSDLLFSMLVEALAV